MSGVADAPVRYRDVLRVTEFRGLIFAQVLSEVGDQIAKVALALLVLDRTGSALGAAAAFAISFVPAFVGSALLGPLADRLSRRSVMLVADLARALLLGVLGLVAIGSAPLWVFFLILLVADFFTPAFDAARNASIPDVLPEPGPCAAGFGLSRSLSLVSQVLGLVAGGAVVAALGPAGAFGVDAISFVLSFVLILALVRPRGAPREGGVTVAALLRDAGRGTRELAADPVRRALLALPFATCIALVAPEALALSYARAQGATDVAGAVLVAAVVGGGAVGSVLVSRKAPTVQADLLLPMAVGATAVLLMVAPIPGVAASLVLWAVVGSMQAFLVPCMAFTTMLTPARERGRVVGVASAGWALANVVSFLLAGLIADRTTPSFAVVVCASLGAVAVSVAILTWPGIELRHRLRALDTVDLRDSVVREHA